MSKLFTVSEVKEKIEVMQKEMKYYVWPSYDDVDLAPTWEVRKKIFWIFSSFECEFDTKEAALDMCNHLNQVDSLKECGK